jgi:ribosomal protein S18 acetylase RimI-like enzyme
VKFLVRTIDVSEIEKARVLLAKNGWSHRVGDEDGFRMLIDNSTIVLVAVVERQVVGFARAITDRLSNGYISMLIVDPAYRKQGIGRALIEAILAYGVPGVTWVLRAGREDAPEFFQSLGFTPSSEAMEIKGHRG